MRNKYISIWSLLIALLGIVACSEMNDLHQDYLDEGEKVYLGKVDTVMVYPGNNKLKLKCVVKSDPKINRIKLMWNNGDEELIVPFNRKHSSTDTIEVDLDPIAENSYLFNIITLDANDNHSVAKELTAVVYGDKYINKLTNKSIASTIATPGSFTIEWKPNSEAISVKVKYEDNDGNINTILTPESETTTVLNNWKPGSTVEYQTEFKPHVNCIDKFYASEETMTLPADFALVKSNFSITALPFDVPGDQWGGSIAKLWNGTVSGGDFMHTGAEGDPMPQHITFDTGVTSDLSRVIVQQRNCCYDALPRVFEVWGIADIDGAETEVNSDDPTWESDMLAKGWVKLKHVELDQDLTAEAGKPLEVELDGDNPSVRYIRMYYIENMTDATKNYVHASEMTFYATRVY
ncbi:hypothetical protein EYV94_09925 [Puteibacter caeruleilacunae]|nr:hypothetical protein EYV94_09925 [Puteibacter caeruleilacunae]